MDDKKTKKNQQERTNDDADKNLVGGILRLEDMERVDNHQGEGHERA